MGSRRRERALGRALLVGLSLLGVLLGARVVTAAPRLGFVPARLTFNPLGESQVVRLHNFGDVPLQLKAVAFSADSAGFSGEQIVPQVLAPGQSLAVTVTYTRSGNRPQAFGALLAYSDDPGGFDDPRSPERDWVRGAALVAGDSNATLWLWLPPLVAAVLLLGLRRLRASWYARWLQAAGLLLPLLASLWLLAHFDPGFAVPDGNYGVQLGQHRALWPVHGVELWTGLDGLSLPLVLLLSVAAAVQPWLPRPAGEPTPVRTGKLTTAARAGEPTTSARAGEPTTSVRAGEPTPSVRAGETATSARAGEPETSIRAGAWLLLSAGSLLVLCSLDAAWLLLGWELALLGAFAWLGGGGNRRARGSWRWFVGSQLGGLLLSGALLMIYAHSLPGPLVDGTTVAHTTDLVKLGYYNYFGDVTVLGVPVARLLWGALALGALLPVLLLAGVGGPLGDRLRLSLPLLVLGVYALVRLGFYVLPQAGVALGPWGVGAALAWGLGFTLRALRHKTLPQLLVAALVARLGGIFVGLWAATQAGVHAALLQLWHYGLAGALLALLLPQGEGAGRRSRDRVGLVGVALLIVDVPGLLGFVQRTLLVVGAFPGFRGAAVVWTVTSFVLPLAALRLALRPAPERSLPAHRPTLSTAQGALAAGLVAAAIVLGVHTQPLIDLSRAFVSDFLTHVFTQLDASTIASLL